MDKLVVSFTALKTPSTESKLDKKLGASIDNRFLPFIQRMIDMEDKIKETLALDHTPDNAAKAKRVWLDFKKIRSEMGAEHKEGKAAYRNVGLYFDQWKNRQLDVSQRVEAELVKLVNYQQIAEDIRLDNQEVARLDLLKPYLSVGEIAPNVRDMETSLFDMLLAGAKGKEERLAAEAAEKAAQKVIDDEINRRVLNMKPWVVYLDPKEQDEYSTATKDRYEELLTKAIRAKDAAVQKLKAEELAKRNEVKPIPKEVAAPPTPIEDSIPIEEETVPLKTIDVEYTEVDPREDAVNMELLVIDIEELMVKYQFSQDTYKATYNGFIILMKQVVTKLNIVE